MKFPRLLLGVLGVVVLCCAFAFVSGPTQAVVLIVALVLMGAGLSGYMRMR